MCSVVNRCVSIDQPQKRLDVRPDPRQARNQLMIVVEQRQRDVRSRAGELLDRPRIDRSVAQTLEDQRRLRERRVERDRS